MMKDFEEPEQKKCFDNFERVGLQSYLCRFAGRGLRLLVLISGIESEGPISRLLSIFGTGK